MNKNMKTVFAAAFALTLIGLSACGDGNSDGNASDITPPAGGSDLQIAPDMSAVPESMTPDERDAAMQKVGMYQESVYSGDIDADNQAVVDYILTLTSEFADAGITPEKTVWARFIDGFPVVFSYITVPVGTPVPTMPTGTSQTGGITAAAEIPPGDKAVLIDVDTLATNSLSTIEPALTKKRYLPTINKGMIDDLISISDISVFFISSHGTPCTNKSGTYSFCVLTNEQPPPYDPNNLHAVNIKSLYNSGEIIIDYMNAHDPNGNLIYDGKFISITEKFITTNWKNAFTPNSLVVIDTCLLFHDGKLSAEKDKYPYRNFRTALYGAGASSLLGWDDEVGKVFASNTMQLFFDRTLGVNAFQAETPKQRPFPFRAVHDWMASNNKQCEGSGACLTLKEHDEPGQLVPTIHNANIYNPAQGEKYAGKWVLEIAGEFGSDPGADGTVKVGGVDRPLLEKWTNDNIKVELPPSMTGPGSYGDLVVTVRNHPSNAVPLTQWTGTVSQSQIDDNIGINAHVDISCPVQGTADVHAARAQPAATPILTSVVNLILTGPCTYSMSGTWTDSTTKYELTGSGSVSPVVQSPVVGSLYSFYPTSLEILPMVFTGGVGFILSSGASGNLQKTNLADGKIANDTVYGHWGYANPTVILGTDYSFTGNSPCIGTPQCTETWSLSPDAAPTTDTES